MLYICGFFLFQGLLDGSTRQTPLYTHSKTLTGMGTLKKTSTLTIGMPHTATMIVVQVLVGDMIFTLLTMRETIIILAFIATVIHTQVPVIAVICGPEATSSVQVS